MLNAPDGAMFFFETTGLFYKYDNGCMFAFSNGIWNQCAEKALIVWTNHHKVIPLPNVKIPWEATKDSICPVPADCMALVWIKSGDNPCLVHAGSIVWSKNAHNTFHSGFVTHYQIEDPDYMRKESADNRLYIGLLPDIETIQTKSAAEQGQLIRIRTDNPDLINKLQILSNVRERFPLIADCAKAAMERLVEKWVELN